MMRGTFGNWRCTFKPSLSFLFLILIRWAQTYMLHLSDLRTGSKARFPCMRVFSHRDLTRDCCTWVHARSPFHVCDICAIYQLIGVSRVRTAGAASNSFLLATAFYSRATAFFQQQQPTAFSCVKAQMGSKRMLLNVTILVRSRNLSVSCVSVSVLNTCMLGWTSAPHLTWPRNS